MIDLLIILAPVAFIVLVVACGLGAMRGGRW